MKITIDVDEHPKGGYWAEIRIDFRENLTVCYLAAEGDTAYEAAQEAIYKVAERFDIPIVSGDE